MKQKGIQYVRGTVFFCLILPVVLGAMTMTGCSLAKGRDLAPREEILRMLQAEGFVFNRHIISTVYGESQNQVIVSGQIARRMPDNSVVANGFKVTQYRRIVVENVNGRWKIISAPQVRG